MTDDDSSNDRVDLRLHELERCFYDPRADFWAGVAAGGELSAKASEKLMREAEAIYRRARASAPRPGSVNVRSAVIDILRKMGGQP